MTGDRLPESIHVEAIPHGMVAPDAGSGPPRRVRYNGAGLKGGCRPFAVLFFADQYFWETLARLGVGQILCRRIA